MANTKVTSHVIANDAITADQLATAAVTHAKLHTTMDLTGKTVTLPAVAIPSASTATTQSASDSTTKVATTAYVTTAISNLVDSAPAALDTLNEIAAALGDDANYASTTTAAIAAKLPLAGGTLTGNLVLSGAPSSGLHPATKTYTDTADALKLNLSGGTLTGDLILNTTTALKIPVGTNAQRPSAAVGQIRWTTDDGALEVYNGSAWVAVGTGSSNKILDTFTGDGSNRTFALSVTPANEDAIMVFIDGAYQEKGDYVLTNASLVLDTAPLSAEKIAVHITTATVHDGTSALNQAFTGDGSTTDFTLSQDPKSENNTQIYINGVYQQKTDYTVTGTTLAFDTAPDTGDIIEVNMFTVATLGNTDTMAEGASNLYHTTARVNAVLPNTGSLSEGSNLYHTTARARSAISVSGNAIAYNSSTGVLTSNFEEGPVFTGTVTTPTLITGAYGGSGSAGDGFRLNSTDLYGQIDASDKVRLTVNGDSFLNGGNVGIGVTPSTGWVSSTDFTALQIGSGLALWGRGSGDHERLGLTANLYHDGSAWKHLNTGRVTAYEQNDGKHIFNYHASQAAGTSVTPTNAMTIDASGKVGIGTSTPDAKLTVNGAANSEQVIITGNNNQSRGLSILTAATGGQQDAKVIFNAQDTENAAYPAIQFETGGTEKIRVHHQSTIFSNRVGFNYPSELMFNGEYNAGLQDVAVEAGHAARIEFLKDDFFRIQGSASVSAGAGVSYTDKLKVNIDSGGILFGSDTAAANTLDDYEEGTWTPAFTFDIGGSGIVYGARSGKYTKVGNIVTVSFKLLVSSGVSASDYWARLGGIPFAGNGTDHFTGRVRLNNTGSANFNLSVDGGTNTLLCYHSNGVSDYARGSHVVGQQLSGAFTYFTNA